MSEEKVELTYNNEKRTQGPDVAAAMTTLDELFKKIESQERSVQYKQMQETYHLKLLDIASQAEPWEWSYGTEFLATFINWMHDYYKLDENVWGMEKKDEDPKRYKHTPTRLQTLEKAIYYYNKWEGVEDEYIQVVKDGDFKSHDNGDGTHTIDDLGYRCIYKYGSAKRTYKKLYKAQQKYKKLFFKTVAKYIESWWD